MNGFQIKEATSEFQKIQSISESDFEKYVLDRKVEIVNHHLKNNDSYQKLVGDVDFKNWSNLPVMEW